MHAVMTRHTGSVFYVLPRVVIRSRCRDVLGVLVVCAYVLEFVGSCSVVGVLPVKVGKCW